MKLKYLARILIPCLTLWIGFMVFNQFSKPAAELGVSNSNLAACPDSPNCVSTQSDSEQHGIPPIAFEGSAQEAIAKIKQALKKMPRMSIVSEKENYLHATATTLLMRYIDDVEFLVDESEQRIHFRSASRIGYSDLGANRQRMEKFRNLFESL